MTLSTTFVRCEAICMGLVSYILHEVDDFFARRIILEAKHTFGISPLLRRAVSSDTKAFDSFS